MAENEQTQVQVEDPPETKDDAAGAVDETSTVRQEAQAETEVKAADQAQPPPVEQIETVVTDSKAGPQDINLLKDVELTVRIELGRSKMLVEDVLKLGDGSIVELDKLAGDPVDIYFNERLAARGEVVVLNDNFCVRISQIISSDG